MTLSVQPNLGLPVCVVSNCASHKYLSGHLQSVRPLTADAARRGEAKVSHQKRLPCIRLISFAEQDRHQESSSKPLSSALAHSAPFLFQTQFSHFSSLACEKDTKHPSQTASVRNTSPVGGIQPPSSPGLDLAM
jgi:hypothetical protein